MIKNIQANQYNQIDFPINLHNNNLLIGTLSNQSELSTQVD